MAAKRTVDPNGEAVSTRFLGVRVTARQMQQIETLCLVREVSKSVLLRQLVQEACDNVQEPF
jgi:hypothetical protein